MPSFNVNMDKVIGFTAKLERLNRSAFPVAVRQTLNDAAFETKKLVPKMASQQFTTRQKNFFNAFSVVNKANGWDVNRMMAVTGINADKGSEVADGLEQQEIGGSIEGRKLIPHNMGRISGSHSKKLSTRHRFRNINIATPKNRKAGAKYIMIKKGGGGTVFEMKRLKSRTKLTPIYVYRRSKKSNVKRSPFMAPAASMAALKMPDFYINNAEYQFKRALK
tara:strand:+ start:12703 stop:13365 length:663 start_codon:yes stop_codon:yes gene_type:complete